MRLVRLTRVFAAMFGVWLLVVLTEPAALHACAMHGRSHGAAPDDSRSHAAVLHNHRAAGSESAPVPSPPHHASCTCIGACCGAVVTALPVVTSFTIVATTVRPARGLDGPMTAHRPSEPEHARPPSQGPPLSLA